MILIAGLEGTDPVILIFHVYRVHESQVTTAQVSGLLGALLCLWKHVVTGNFIFVSNIGYEDLAGLQVAISG